MRDVIPVLDPQFITYVSQRLLKTLKVRIDSASGMDAARADETALPIDVPETEMFMGNACGYPSSA
jgi:hypothetical protein